MKTCKKIIYLVSILLTAQTTVHAQTLGFQILRSGKEIGKISAQKKELNAKTTYTVKSKASFRVVFKYVRETITNVICIGGKLESSESKQIMNDDLKDYRITKWQDSKYACRKNQEQEKFNIKEQIEFCTSMLYFMEPKGLTHVFAEAYQELCPIKRIEPGIYELILPGEKTNHYVYKRGQLEEIRVFRTIVDLVFRRES